MKQFEKLREYCKQNNITYTDATEKKMQTFCEMLVETNKVMNLTAVTEPEEVELRHLIDSLASAIYVKQMAEEMFSRQGDGKKQLHLVDVGTGAGFPGIPLAIVFPEHKFLLTDALQKRIGFLSDVKHNLSLDNIELLQIRAEELGQSEQRESFDICVSRAVADMSVLLEYCLPLLKVGGVAILYKSGEFQEETAQAATALQVLGGCIERVQEFTLPGTDIRRSLIFVKKEKATPEKYPRRPGKPAKSPIK